LTGLEGEKLRAEHEELSQRIAALSGLLEDDKKIYSLIKEESLQLKDSHAGPRRAQILPVEASQTISAEDLIPNDR
jgi:DNA gyrase subunit A